MKRILSITICLFISINIFSQSTSQNISIKWGGKQDISMLSKIMNIFGYSNNGFYILKYSYRRKGAFSATIDYELQHYDHNMKLTTSANIDTKDKHFYTVLPFGGNLYLFTTKENDKKNTSSLYEQTVNQRTLKLNNDIKEVASINKGTKKNKTSLMYGGMTIMKNRGIYGIIPSYDSSKILIYSTYLYGKKDSVKYGLSVFNNKMQIIWKKHINLPFLHKTFEIKDFKLDNSGNVYLLGKHTTSNKDKSDSKYEILAYTNSGKNIHKYPMQTTDNGYITDMKIKITSQQYLICAGLYAYKEYLSGLYLLKINLKSQTAGSPILCPNTTMKNGELPATNYYVDHIILRNNDAVMLTAEQYYYFSQTKTTTPDGLPTHSSSYSSQTTPGGIPNSNGFLNQTSVYEQLHFGKILVTEASFNGKTNWTNFIYKDQQGDIREMPDEQLKQKNELAGLLQYASYSIFVNNNSVSFIFNDNKKNITSTREKSKIHTCNLERNSIPVIVKINNDGKMTSKTSLDKNLKPYSLISPVFSHQFSVNKMNLYMASKNKKFSFGEINIQ